MRLVAVTLTMLAMFGCDEETACDRWADYVCACKDGQDGFDCQELRDLAEGASTSVDEQCAVDLADQQQADDDAGETCEL
jgi:hypothetical protein